MRTAPYRWAGVFLLLAMGCTAPQRGAELAEEASLETGTVGLVRVEAQALQPAVLALPDVVVEAAFARFEGVDREAVVALLGGRSAPVGECLVGGEEATAFAAPAARVDLLDVGDLTVATSEVQARITPRAFPDLAGLVSGAFYAEGARLSSTVAGLNEYYLQAPGQRGSRPGDDRGPAPGAFSTSLVVPPGVSGLRIDGVAAPQAAVLRRGTDVELVWDRSSQPVRPSAPYRDLVQVTLDASGSVLECVVPDTGALQLPGTLLATLSPDPEAQLGVSRVRESTFEAASVDEARLSIATAQSLTVSVR